jgi:hypothetical protein
MSTDQSTHERALILLQAARDLLDKQNRSGYVLNLLEETVHYDEADCDGSCLLEEITALLEDSLHAAYLHPAVPSAAPAIPVGEVVANDPVHGWHMRPLVDWEAIGAGTKLYTHPAPSAAPGDAQTVRRYRTGDCGICGSVIMIGAIGDVPQYVCAAAPAAPSVQPVDPITAYYRDRNRGGWASAEKISDQPLVHEALEAFSHDSTGDNATGLVRAVLNAASAVPHPVLDLIERMYRHHTTTSLPLAIERYGSRGYAAEEGGKLWLDEVPAMIKALQAGQDLPQLEDFMGWFRKNYPPGTEIFDPDWHGRRILASAMCATQAVIDKMHRTE